MPDGVHVPARGSVVDHDAVAIDRRQLLRHRAHAVHEDGTDVPVDDDDGDFLPGCRFSRRHGCRISAEGRPPELPAEQLRVDAIHVSQEPLDGERLGDPLASRDPKDASPIRSASSVCIAFVRAAGSPGGTRAPVTPSSTRSGTPPTRVAATGRPAAIASISETGEPSLREVSTTRSRSA